MGRKVGIESDELLSVIYDAIGSKLTAKEAYKKYPGLDHAIRREYGGLKELNARTGISFPRKARNTDGYRKYSDEQLTRFVQKMDEDGNNGAKAKVADSKIFEACTKRWGSWNKALIANGITPKRTTPRTDWSKEELARIYLDELANGVSKQEVSNQAAIRKHFGGLIEIQKYLGLYEDVQYELLSKISIDCYVNQALKMDVGIINEQTLDELNINLSYSIKQHYGSTASYFSIIDIDRYKKPYTPFTWTKENIVWQLERWIREGYPVNYTAIQSKHKGIIKASRRLFGSYEKAFAYAGLDYEDYRVDTAMASRQGHVFEKVLSEIFDELKVEYLRHPTINGCHPDFVFGDHWVDAKLSEWTVSFADCGTIHKYLPHCQKLSIIYLRRASDKTFYTNDLGVDMVHVSELLKELPPDRVPEYERRLNEILEVLEANAA